ncbi:MAG: mechanosensitive ion channel family protein [Deltaproteobacteria bacterium]
MWNDVYFGNAVSQWTLAAAAILATILATLLLLAWAKHQKRKKDPESFPLRRLPAEVLERSRWYLALGLSALIAPRFLDLPERAGFVTVGIGVIAIGIQIGIYLARAVDYLIEREAYQRAAQSEVMSSFGVLKFIGHTVVWVLVLVLVLANLGIDVTGLVASLGVGGIAVALAAQNVLSDLFASLSIVLDRPFEVGDFIIVGAEMGTVERIGLKTTRVRSLGGEQLVFSNTDLLSSRIRNYKRMEERRIVFEFGLEYGSPPAKLREVPAIVKSLVDAVSEARFDRAHFKAFGDSSLDFEVVYYTLTPDYAKYMDVQQTLNLGLVERMQTLGLSFAFPTRTLHVETMPQAAAS